MREKVSREKLMSLLSNDKLLEVIIDRYRFSALGGLIKGVVHNLNGSLQILSMHMETLQRMLLQEKEDITHPFRQKVEQCSDQVDQFKALIEVLMKKGIEHEEEGLQSIQIKDLLEECQSLLFFNLFFKHHVKIVKNISPALPPVQARYSDLSLVLWNLIQNALEAMEKSPTKLLTLGADMQNKQIRVAVQDTGCGISEDARAHLFEPFFTTKKEKHRGLGLFATQLVLKACGASLEFYSGEGETTFTVYLPTSPARGI